MYLLPLSVLGLFYAFSTITTTSARETSSSGTISLSDDLTNFIPLCAQDCFVSFIQANFPESVCSTSPSLECLCTHNSTSGYTVGEGAVQCIVSEDDIEACKGANATKAVVANAYGMCAGHANAISNTHATISATLVLQTTNTNVVLVASTDAKTTSRSTSAISTSSSASSSSTAGSSSAAVGEPSPSPTAHPSSASSLPTSQSSSASSTPTPAAASNLTSGQVAGIAIGSVGAAAVAAGILIAVICIRRRKLKERGGLRKSALDSEESLDFGTWQPIAKPGPWDPSAITGGHFSATPPNCKTPERPARILTDPNMFARSSTNLAPVKTSAIGVAYSPEGRQILNSGMEEERRPSKLLPPKPSLTVQIPQQAKSSLGAPLNFSLPAVASGDRADVDPTRASTMTEFEEDVNSALEYSVHDAYLSDYYRGQAPTIAPIQYSNRSERSAGTAPLSIRIPSEASIRPLNIRKSQQPPPRYLYPQGIRRVIPPAGVYPRDGSSAPTGGDSGVEHVGWRPRNPKQAPQTYRPYRSLRRERRGSSGSATSFESLAGPDYEYAPRRSELHTIPATPTSAGSPAGKSPKGVSPVTYPHPSSFGHPAYRTAPPPAQPNFGQVYPRPGARTTRTGQDHFHSGQHRRMSKNTMTSQGPHPRSESALSARSDSSSLAIRRARPTPTLNLRSGDDPFVAQPSKSRVRNVDHTRDSRRPAGRYPEVLRREERRTPDVQPPNGVHLTPKLIGNDLYLHVG
ncbi:MAG: hypothetical protein M1818_004100 [Claussenomyces sp. TS43310]|nr:MAG: hypothetical protein M1818_004100 [Claussenomyces sp. TS43310]